MIGPEYAVGSEAGAWQDAKNAIEVKLTRIVRILCLPGVVRQERGFCCDSQMRTRGSRALTAFVRVCPSPRNALDSGLKPETDFSLECCVSDPSQKSNGRLVGWKRIANHLGCSERTARRWEREEQLPVHRQQHAAQSTVYAHMEELETWLQARSGLYEAPANTTRRGVPIVGWVGLAVIIAIFVAGFGILSVSSNSSASQSGSEDAIAVDLYEQGRSLWLQRGKEPNERAVKLLTEAVSRDENYAEAWQALSSAWMTLPTYSDSVSQQKALNEALFAADRAIQLNPNLVEVRSVMASVAQSRGDWIGSERIFEEALQRDPGNTMLMLWLAEHYRDIGLIEKNKEELVEALKLDPTSPPLLVALAMMQHVGPDPDLAYENLQSIWTGTGFKAPTAWFGIWHLYVRAGDYDAAEAWIAESPVPIDAQLLKAFLQAKRSGEASAISGVIPQVFEAYENGFQGWFAYTLLDHLGATEDALEIAERETETGRFELSVVMFDPLFPAARMTPRFEDIVDRLGYVEYWRQNGPPDFCQDQPRPPICDRLSE
jgi:tetratricopeptide (TPR) repeat protein